MQGRYGLSGDSAGAEGWFPGAAVWEARRGPASSDSHVIEEAGLVAVKPELWVRVGILRVA